jgi:hypothetical protein
VQKKTVFSGCPEMKMIGPKSFYEPDSAIYNGIDKYILCAYKPQRINMKYEIKRKIDHFPIQISLCIIKII